MRSGIGATIISKLHPVSCLVLSQAHSFSCPCCLSFSVTSSSNVPSLSHICLCCSYPSLSFLPSLYVPHTHSPNTPSRQALLWILGWMNTQLAFAVWDLRLGNYCLYYFYVDESNKINSSAYEMVNGIGVFFCDWLTRYQFFWWGADIDSFPVWCCVLMWIIQKHAATCLIIFFFCKSKKLDP